MKVSELVRKLTELQETIGDVDVLITDGGNAQCYSGEYEIAEYKEINGVTLIDIDIGGTLQ